MSIQLPNHQTTKLILASSSPWRATLLKQAGFQFDIVPTDLDESPYQQSITDPKLLVKTLAEKKAEACAYNLRGCVAPTANLGGSDELIILAADTIVWAAQQIIGKPQDRQDAKRIISLLAGTAHQVWTGVCILRIQPPRLNRPEAEKTSEVLFADKTLVTFRSMTDQEIETYLDTNDWVGKAGAYQLQQNIGKFVEKIVGDPDTIIGLPSKTNDIIRELITLCGNQ